MHIIIIALYIVKMKRNKKKRHLIYAYTHVHNTLNNEWSIVIVAVIVARNVQYQAKVLSEIL